MSPSVPILIHLPGWLCRPLRSTKRFQKPEDGMRYSRPYSCTVATRKTECLKTKAMVFDNPITNCRIKRYENHGIGKGWECMRWAPLCFYAYMVFVVFPPQSVFKAVTGRRNSLL